jgi:predicted phosphoribosyltransferase
LQPFDLNSVCEWYEDFSQTTDDEVRSLLERARDFAPQANEKNY